MDPAGTTLVATIIRAAPAGYARLLDGPGWPTKVRDDFVRLKPARVADRVGLASVVHLTDVHIIDAQSPGRVEYLDGVNPAFSAAFRPQETLTTHVQASMVDRIRALRSGPITGRRFDCAVSTGDNIDNQQHNELDWFIGVLDGGSITANSGAANDYEGVQLGAWADERYWQPEPGTNDRFTDAGFPHIEGFLDAAIAPFESAGLDIAWYSTYGNHDGLLQGNLARTDAIDRLLTGPQKITGLRSTPWAAAIGTFANDTASIPGRVGAGELEAREVTPDTSRRTVTTAEWVRAHLDSPAGPGPAGHGYNESHLDGTALYYRFEIAPGVIGLSLDTGGYNSGSIGERQLRWLETELQSVHSIYYEANGNERCRVIDDHLVIVFSHFTRGTMTGSIDPGRPDERRVNGPELTDTLLRYPNVIAWVNGHTHSNHIEPVTPPTGRKGGFWEITTASHVDFPEQARIIEVTDNADGTLSIFTTMIEHAAPAAADYGDLTATGLASISRELAANNDIDRLAAHVGETDSLNVELALVAPFPLETLQSTRAERIERQRNSAAGEPRDADDSSPVATIGTAAGVVGLGAAGLAAIVQRRRRVE